MDLVAALEADRGLVGVVGAGGKKSLMYRLAHRLDRAVVTATVRIPIFDRHVARVIVTSTPARAVDAADPGDWPFGLVPERDGEDRYRGYDPAVIDELATHGDVQTILVKADGARMRRFKAPGEDEPQVPRAATVVAPVVSARAIGEPLAEGLVHRVEHVRRLTGLSVGDELTTDAVARVIANDRGGHKGVPDGATVVPTINMVDTPSLERRARRLAGAILERCGAPRVVLTQLTADDPLVDVIEAD